MDEIDHRSGNKANSITLGPRRFRCPSRLPQQLPPFSRVCEVVSSPPPRGPSRRRELSHSSKQYTAAAAGWLAKKEETLLEELEDD